MAQYVQFDNKVFNKIRNQITAANGTVIQPAVVLNFASDLNFWRFGAFGQVAKSFVNDRLSVSAGIRTDMNSFTDTGLNPLQTLSPRAALSYALTSKWTVNASVGRYFKLPVYTVLGYKDSQTGQFANKSNTYINSNHYVAGSNICRSQAAALLWKASINVTVTTRYRSATAFRWPTRAVISVPSATKQSTVTARDRHSAWSFCFSRN